MCISGKKTLIMGITCVALIIASSALAKTQISQELIDRAKKEGEVNWATGVTRVSADPFAKAFEDTYGIKVNLTRIGTESLMGRFYTEMEIGACRFDVLTTGKPPIGVYKERGWVKQHFSPKLKEIDQKVIKDVFYEPNGYWIPFAGDFQIMAYNNRIVSAAEAPKKWTDLLNPKYKGMIGVADPRYSGTAFLNNAAIVENYGWKFFDEFAKNKIQIGRGHGALLETMLAGETPIAGMMLFYIVGGAIQRGEPISVVFPEDGAVPTPWQSFISTGSPNPNAAELLIEWSLSEEAQKILVEKGSLYPVIRGIEAPGNFPSLSDIKFMSFDVQKAEKNNEEIKNTYWQKMGQ